MHHSNSLRRIAVAALCCTSAACVVGDESDTEPNQTEAPAASTPATAPAPQTPPDLAFIVDISDRKLFVLRGQDTVKVADVAVGMADHPTPTGDWHINRVDWNPDWTPPPGEEWTEDKDPQPPGAAANPMGRARLVFEPPYSIHGTKDRASLGTAESHGSIRVANEVVIELGKMVMEAGGASRPETFHQQVAADRTKMEQITIPNPVPIKVQQ